MTSLPNILLQTMEAPADLSFFNSAYLKSKLLYQEAFGGIYLLIFERFAISKQTAEKEQEKNRPAHKGYNKLSAKEDSRTSAEVHSNQDILDNESGIAANNGNAQTNGNPGLMDSDNESTFTDLDYEDGGFSDDSDYEKLVMVEKYT
ncbi:hypothetical protein HUJ04_006550 [Dendroctonus ponderosae]|nr:hypothetical protein HUJ04_006550 [Dendroctonus ponderosae]